MNRMNMMNEQRTDQLEEIMANNTARSSIMMLKIVVEITYICHILACIWVLVGRIGNERGRHTWLKQVGYEHTSTEELNNEYSEDMNGIYIQAFYFCFTTMTSVGYGDISAYNFIEMYFSIGAQIVGGFVYAMIIASLTAVVTFQESNDRMKNEKVNHNTVRCVQIR
jgi:hypothetical protein